MVIYHSIIHNFNRYSHIHIFSIYFSLYKKTYDTRYRKIWKRYTISFTRWQLWSSPCCHLCSYSIGHNHPRYVMVITMPLAPSTSQQILLKLLWWNHKHHLQHKRFITSTTLIIPRSHGVPLLWSLSMPPVHTTITTLCRCYCFKMLTSPPSTLWQHLLLCFPKRLKKYWSRG